MRVAALHRPLTRRSLMGFDKATFDQQLDSLLATSLFGTLWANRSATRIGLKDMDPVTH